MASLTPYNMTLEGVQLKSVLPAQPAEDVIVDTFPMADAEALKRIKTKLDTTIFRLLMSAATVEELRELRKEELFEKYIKLSLAYGNFISAVIPSQGDFYALIQGVFGAMAKKFQETELFDPEMRAEAVFCLTTFHRAHALLPSVVRSLRDEASSKERDQDLCTAFVGTMFWAQMHLNCLFFAIKEHLTPAPDVLRDVLSQFRASVPMYAAIREAVELRVTPDDEQPWPDTVVWDAEDGALALESTNERDSLIH